MPAVAVTGRSAAVASPIPTTKGDTGPAPPREEQFYEPFADWLREEDEVTAAVALGGSSMKGKWGTPDVVGLYRARASHAIQFPPEIVTAEVKVNPGEAVTAFGQAVAYRLFSHKTYVVLPEALDEDEKTRLESLCGLLGVGLVFFNRDPKAPTFEGRVRAQRLAPDLFYANEFAERLRAQHRERFDELFG